MPIDFFHQAHLNNWQRYLATLKSERPAGVWDWVVLTAANEKQAAAYRYQLDGRRELDMLPKRTQFRVIADPEGARIGSGGATLNVLVQLAEHMQAAGAAGGCLANRRVLVLHSGGDCKRLPQYSAFGKIFSPIPRLLESGRPSTLFDELFVALGGLPGAMAPGVVVASGDVLLLFDHTQLDVSRPGFTGVAIKTTAETASHHGVYVADATGLVRHFLHKPSLATLAACAAVDGDGNVPVDTGIVYFGGDSAERLRRQASGPDGWLATILERRATVNFYGDFLAPLAPETEYHAYLNDTSDGPATPALQALRRELWRTLRGLPFYAGVLQPARFLHFGTTREYQRLTTYEDRDVKALGGRRRVSHFLATGARVAEHACILHSRIGERSEVSPGATVEFSDLGADTRIGLDSVVSNVRMPAGTTTPAASVVHGLPVTVRDESRFAIRVWGVDDNPKATMPAATLLGRPLVEWLPRLGLETADVWPAETNDAERSLWNAKLYPLATTQAEAWALSVRLLQVAEAWESETSAASSPWAGLERMALADSCPTADLEAIGGWHKELFLELVEAKCMDAFTTEKCVAEWRDKIPTGTDMRALLYRLRRQATRRPHSLENARLCYSVAYLTGLYGDATEVDALENRAFAQIAECMHAARQQRHFTCAVDGWRQDESAVQLPVRVDFAGGWSDTPPHCLERGGTVLNAAISLAGKRPIGVVATRLPEATVVLESVDLGLSQTFREASELLACSNPHDPLALHKAALTLVLPKLAASDSLPDVLQALGGGIHLRSEVFLPKGTGLGASSLLAAALVKALLQLGLKAGREPSHEIIYEAAAAIEQMLTTGGGWQDQCGGVAPGVKLITSRPGCYQDLTVETVSVPAAVRREIDDRLIVLDTGQRRLAKNLLREIMGSWLRRDPHAVAILNEIQTLAHEGAAALTAGDFSAFGRMLWRHWELNKRWDAGVSNGLIDALMDALRPHVEGAKLSGAGGGGFLLGIAKPGGRERIRQLVDETFAANNVAFYDAAIVW